MVGMRLEPADRLLTRNKEKEVTRKNRGETKR